ncbi:MAG: ComF family protein [Bacteroides sp.]|nr:ComF family protein [Bacteroides sp.]
MARRPIERLNLWWEALLSVAMPAVCEVCGRTLTDGERHACLACLTSLPRTNFHLNAENNPIHHLVCDNRVIACRAAAMFHYYRNSPTTSLILSAKYRERPAILSMLGRIYAAEIASSGFFAGIDRIVPVPIHWSRRIMRGYNQSEYLARGLSRVTGITVDTSLLRLPSRHSTQTRRNAAARAANVAGTFVATSRAPLLNGTSPHILLVDDIVTTGSTIHDCMRALAEAIPDVRMSILSIGIAHPA